MTKGEVLKTIQNFLEENPKGVIEILGPTASGKTQFALEVAKYFSPAEIICVDSRQIFKDVNIASAKITENEKQGIVHWGIDLITPEEKYSVFDFQTYAFKKIEEILSRSAHPILCGGTMLWLDAISENYNFSENKNEKSTQKNTPRYPFFKIGIHWDRKVLYERINERAKKQFAEGLIEETKEVMQKYKLSPSSLTSFGYKEIQEYLAGKISKQEAIEINQQRNRNYAKRQLTWWRGREDILWIDGASR